MEGEETQFRNRGRFSKPKRAQRREKQRSAMKRFWQEIKEGMYEAKREPGYLNERIPDPCSNYRPHTWWAWLCNTCCKLVLFHITLPRGVTEHQIGHNGTKRTICTPIIDTLSRCESQLQSTSCMAWSGLWLKCAFQAVILVSCSCTCVGVHYKFIDNSSIIQFFHHFPIRKFRILKIIFQDSLPAIDFKSFAFNLFPGLGLCIQFVYSVLHEIHIHSAKFKLKGVMTSL